jgi:hypothetical protein
MTRRFDIGFAVRLSIWIAINLLSAHLSSDCGLLAVFERDACADDIARSGWPFRFYERGGIDYRYNFEPSVLALDLGIAVVFALVMGLFVSSYKKALPK